MYIFDWISTNVLNFETEKSRAYISNSITGELFWLEKESSDLWYVLLHSKTKDEVVEYAKKRNLIDELPEFLNLLKNLGLCAEEGSAPSANFLTLKRKEVLNNENSKFLNEWSQVNIKEKKITRIQFDVTYGCNERCIHCFCDKDTNDVQITFDKIKPIIDDAYDLGLTQVVFSGGECTLIDDFLEIAKYIKEKRIELVVFTNGQKLYDDEKFFNEFVKLHPFSVGLSLYSMQPEIHDSITQIKGSHHKTLSVIKKLAKSNILVEIKCFLTKYNADCYQEVLEFAKNNNFKIVVDECLQANKDNTNKFSEITEEQLYSLYKYQYKNNFSNFTKKLDDEFLEDFPCMSGRTTLDIDPFLNVTSCPTANFNFANLNNLSLKEFWNNSDEQSLLKHWSSLKRKDFKNCFDKEYCAYCNFCPSKCVNEEEKIGIYCRNAKIKMEVVKSESRL